MENIEIEKLKELLLDSELLEDLKRKIDNSVNIFDILKIFNFEKYYSNVIAWLLDPNENHGLGDEFLKRLINFLAMSCKSNDKIVKLLLTNNYSYIVRREWRNIDLLLTSSESKIVIAIENKVKSGEHSNQLTRYRETVIEQFHDYQHYFLFLTLEGYESSDPEVWLSLGYEDILEWISTLLESSSLKPETQQILRQYHSVLWREIMGYPKEVTDLCNKIYEKHKEALNLIYENIVEEETNFEEWGEEWIKNNLILSYECDKNTMYFRTSTLDELFPVVVVDGDEKWPCYYSIDSIPFPSRIYIEFGSQRFDNNTMKKFKKIKSIFNNRSLKDNWQWHKLKTWELPEYYPDTTVDFSEISDRLKAELERMITEEIAEFEADVKNILKLK